MNGIELRGQKQTHTYMVNCFSTSMPRPFNGEGIVFSTNGIETAGYSHGKEWSWTSTSYYAQKLTWKKSKCKSKNSQTLWRDYRSKSSQPQIRQQFLKYDIWRTNNNRKNNKIDFIKICKTCALRILVNHIPDKDLVVEIYKELKQRSKDKQLILNMGKGYD